MVHYFTKVGSGEYYLEELEETFCALEMKRKLILEQGLFGMYYDDADDDQDPNDEEFNDFGEEEVLIGDHNHQPSGIYHHYRDHNGRKKTVSFRGFVRKYEISEKHFKSVEFWVSPEYNLTV